MGIELHDDCLAAKEKDESDTYTSDNDSDSDSGDCDNELYTWLS